MQVKQDKIMKTVQRILWGMMVAVVLFLILGETLMPRENISIGHDCKVFDLGFEPRSNSRATLFRR